MADGPGRPPGSRCPCLRSRQPPVLPRCRTIRPHRIRNSAARRPRAPRDAPRSPSRQRRQAGYRRTQPRTGALALHRGPASGEAQLLDVDAQDLLGAGGGLAKHPYSVFSRRCTSRRAISRSIAITERAGVSESGGVNRFAQPGTAGPSYPRSPHHPSHESGQKRAAACCPSVRRKRRCSRPATSPPWLLCAIGSPKSGSRTAPSRSKFSPHRCSTTCSTLCARTCSHWWRPMKRRLPRRPWTGFVLLWGRSDDSLRSVIQASRAPATVPRAGPAPVVGPRSQRRGNGDVTSTRH